MKESHKHRQEKGEKNSIQQSINPYKWTVYLKMFPFILATMTSEKNKLQHNHSWCVCLFLHVCVCIISPLHGFN